jgi:hypothetical protein
MWVCVNPDCRKIWRVQMHSCHTCKTPGVRPFGGEPADAEHPAVANRPTRSEQPKPKRRQRASAGATTG